MFRKFINHKYLAHKLAVVSGDTPIWNKTNTVHKFNFIIVFSHTSTITYNTNIVKQQIRNITIHSLAYNIYTFNCNMKSYTTDGPNWDVCQKFKN